MNQPPPLHDVQPATNQWHRQLAHSGVIAVLVPPSHNKGMRALEVLIESGISSFEIAFRTPAAPSVLAAGRVQFPHACFGAGTIWRADLIDMAADAGAHFAVSPGVSPEVIARAAVRRLPFAPGVMTPSDIETSLRCGCRLMKYFPFDSAGQLAHLEKISSPFQVENPQFIPLGGIDQSSLEIVLGHPLVLAVGGSWLAPEDLVANCQWSEIKSRAATALATVQAVRLAKPSRKF